MYTTQADDPTMKSGVISSLTSRGTFLMNFAIVSVYGWHLGHRHGLSHGLSRCEALNHAPSDLIELVISHRYFFVNVVAYNVIVRHRLCGNALL